MRRGEKQQLEDQLRLAHQVQSRLLPQAPPDVPGWDVATSLNRLLRSECRPHGFVTCFLGVFEKASWGSRQVTLEPGAALVLHTDGVVEARRPDGDELGSERLRALVRDGLPRGAKSAANGVVTAARDFTGAPGFEDDFTLVLVARTGVTPDGVRS